MCLPAEKEEDDSCKIVILRLLLLGSAKYKGPATERHAAEEFLLKNKTVHERLRE